VLSDHALDLVALMPKPVARPWGSVKRPVASVVHACSYFPEAWTSQHADPAGQSCALVDSGGLGQFK
jgi:hypothetical protein